MPTEIAKGFKLLNPGPLDSLRGPYDTLAAALLAIPNTTIDGKNFREGKVCEVGTAGTYITYWWKGGFADANLVPYVDFTPYVTKDSTPTAYYGPYASNAAALIAVPLAVRKVGTSIGILTSGKVVDWWWESSTADSGLVIKTVDLGSVNSAIDKISLSMDKPPITGVNYKSGTDRSPLSSSRVWVQTDYVRPAGQRIGSITFPMVGPASSSVLVFSKSGAVYTCIDEIFFTGKLGDNTVLIGKKYAVDTYYGFDLLAGVYYGTLAGGSISSLPSAAAAIGASGSEVTNVVGKIQFTVNYSDAQYALNDVVDVGLNGLYKESFIDSIDFPWKTAAPAIAGYFSGPIGNVVPFPETRLVSTIEYYSNTPASALLLDVRPIKALPQAGAVVTVRSTIVISPADYTKTIDGNIVRFKLKSPIAVDKGEYLISNVIGIAYTAANTDFNGTFRFDGTSWLYSASNAGVFVAYSYMTFDGLKEQIQKIKNAVDIIGSPKAVTQSILKSKSKVKSIYNFNFAQATTDYLLNSWTVAGGVASTTAVNSKLVLNKRYVSSKKFYRISMSFKSDTVANVGTILQSGSAAMETSMIIDVPNSLIKLCRMATSVVIAQTALPTAIISDVEYLIELESFNTAVAIRLINQKTGAVTEAAFDYVTGSNYANGGGNLSPYLAIQLLSGSGLSVRSVTIFGLSKPELVAMGDSNTDENGRPSGNTWARLVIDNLGGDGCIVAKSGATIENLIESITNEVIPMAPVRAIVMIGTNNASPSLAQYQNIYSLLTNAGIETYFSHVICKSPNDHVAKNALIDAVTPNQVLQADVATALNNDPAQGYDPAKYIDLIHINQTGHNDLAQMVYVNLPVLRRL